MISKLVLLGLLFILSSAADGIIVKRAFSNYTCVKQYKDLAIIRAYLPTGIVDPDALANIKASNAAGLLTDVLM